MNIGILHYSNSIIDVEKLFGMQMMELKVARELQKRNIEVLIFAKGVKGKHPLVHELVYKDIYKELYDIPYFIRFIDANVNADILWGWGTPLLAALDRKRCVIRLNGYFDFPLWEREEIRECYANVTYICVSEYIRNYYIQRFPFMSNSNCHVLYNGTDFNSIPRKPKGKKIRMLFCSRWVRDKGIYLLINVLKRLAKERNDYEVLIGGGLHSTSLEDSNREIEMKLSLKFESIPNVSCIGYIPHKRLLKLLGDTDLLLFPSLWDEPSGNLVAEAAMAGVPTVAFSTGGIPEFIVHEKTGVLIRKSGVEFMNARRYYKAISRLLDNPNLIEEMGHQAREMARKLFSWDKYLNELLLIFRHITESNRRTHPGMK